MESHNDKHRRRVWEPFFRAKSPKNFDFLEKEFFQVSFFNKYKFFLLYHKKFFLANIRVFFIIWKIISFIMSITKKFLLVMMLIIISGLYILPWKNFGINNDFLSKSYVLGLDLQGGVELDYKVDFPKTQTGLTEQEQNNNEFIVVEGLKKIIDKRVGSLGLSEPTIQTLKYGNETHIIVQIPTESYNNLSEEERKIRQAEDIKKAKETIGKVVQLEFKELRTDFSEEDFAERKKIAENAIEDLKNSDFETLSQKYNSSYERVIVKNWTGTIPAEANSEEFEIEKVENFPFVFDKVAETRIPVGINPQTGEIRTGTGYLTLKLNEKISENEYNYSYILVDSEPSEWKSATADDGRVLNDKYLVSAAAGLTQVGGSEVQLVFNDEWKEIFAQITKRLIGQPVAIFVGGEMLTAPTIQATITNWQAVITGQSSYKESQDLANDITTGIVPAPIYLTSERTIDAKIWEKALEQILIAWAIGLSAIIIFLVYFYRIGGLMAGVALVSYAIILIALVKFFGVVLTLASIAGVILSIGLAIDANILIFERTHEALKERLPLNKAIIIGFKHSWSAIWDSHITSFMSAFVLFAFGVSLIKWFGFMLAIGILLSLFTAMWVSRILILYFAQFIKNPKILVGYNREQ